VLLYPPDADCYCVGTTVPNSSLAFADFDVVIDDDGEDDEDPHGKNDQRPVDIVAAKKSPARQNVAGGANAPRSSWRRGTLPPS
jgi:hypothetical protein